MLDYIFTIRLKANYDTRLVKNEMINGLFMTKDCNANKLIVDLYDGALQISDPPSNRITICFIRSDGEDIEVDTSLNEDNKPYVVIPSYAYEVSGLLSIKIKKYENSSESTVIGSYTCYVKDTNTWFI